MQNLNQMNQNKLQYFCDYWRDFTAHSEDKVNERHSFKNLEQDSINHILYNPKELFREFINEIEIKNLSNGDNKKFFMENIKNLARLKIKALNFLESSLKIIIQQFSQKDDFSYLLHTLQFTLSEMINFRLGKECVNELAEILANDTNLDDNKDNIKHLVHFIVFELHDKGFSHKRINDIVRDIFDNYIEINGYVTTRFPHNIRQNGSTGKDRFEYQNNLKEFIDSLTNKDRILAIISYFKQETISARFIFRVKGIKGELNIKTNDIEIYNPLKKELINIKLSDEKELYDENFGLQDSQKAIQGLKCNIAVRANVFPNDTESAKYEAIRKAHIFFDGIMARYFRIKVKLGLDATKHYVINDDGNIIGGSSSVSKEFIDYQNAEITEHIDINENLLKYYGTLTLQDNLTDIDKQISRALTWKRTALEATNYNESILWHWVGIENLFHCKNETTKLIFRIAPKILAKTYIYHLINQIFLEIRAKSFPFQNYNITEKAQKIIENMPENMTYEEFIEKVKEICKYLDKNSFFYEKLDKFVNIFDDKNKFKEFIENYRKQAEQKIIFLYRLRNKIAHNANSEYSATIIYYKNFADYISTILVCYFIDRRILGYKDNSEIIYCGEYEYNKMLLDIEQKGIDCVLTPQDK